MKKIILVFITIIVFLGSLAFNYSRIINTGLASNMIRLHVVANSNSKNDQLLKLQIRDKVLEYTNTLLKNSKNIDETNYILRKNMDGISNVVKDYMREKNINYAVKLSLGEFSFPTKTYGDVVLPAGKYQALRVLVGEAKGKNWWCVLFPPLCFVDATHGKLSQATKQKLSRQLTKEEYNIISKKKDDIQIKFKFKVVELFQISKIKLAGLFSKN